MTRPVVRIRRVMPAPPDAVFGEWLDPDALMDWMCPRPTRCVAVTVEPHVGGRVRFDIDDCGRSVLISGQFLVVDRPRHLRFTWSHSGWADPSAASVVDVTFEPHGDHETLMSIEHTLLPAEAVDDHDHGWSVSADQLRQLLTQRLRFVAVGQDDPLAVPLIDELAVEYADRYGGQRDRVHAWLRGYPAAEFDPPSGGLLIGLLDGRPVTGGAFRRFDDTTAELKRIWTDSRHRRRGHAKVLVKQLESAIAARGYTRVYLTTGDRQPEAEALYESMGYTRLDEPLPYDGETYSVAFLKALT